MELVAASTGAQLRDCSWAQKQANDSRSAQTRALNAVLSKSTKYELTSPSTAPQTCGHASKHRGASAAIC